MERVTMLAIAVAVVSLTACSGGRFSSNLEEYGQAKIQSSVVKLYRQDEIFNRDYVVLGQVETSFCGDVSDLQEGRYAPSEAVMKDALKLQTRKLGGNALVIKQCGKGNYRGCSIYTECIGLAYQLTDA